MKLTKGQGLLETIVAIGVVMTGLVSVLALVISNLNTQRDAALRYQAINLAREAIELTRNRRDTNWLSSGGATWDGLPGGEVASVGTDFIIPVDPEASDTPVLAIASEQNVAVCQTENGIFSQHVSGCLSGEEQPSIFSRRITLEQLNCTDLPALSNLGCDAFTIQTSVALRITAQVGWQQGNRARNVAISETLYDWR